MVLSFGLSAASSVLPEKYENELEVFFEKQFVSFNFVKSECFAAFFSVGNL